MGFSFSFKPRFVNPIRAGLGLYDADHDRYPPSGDLVKRQTIRAERKDGRRPKVGDELHLFTAMRTKRCQRIVPRQIAFCTRVSDIVLVFKTGPVGFVIGNFDIASAGYADPDEFARGDGFQDWEELRAFWAAEHPGIEMFEGFITFWERQQ